MIRHCHPAPAGIAIAMISLGLACAANDSLPARDSAGLVATGRAMLRSGRVDEARRLIERAMDAGADDALWCLAGEVQFRNGDFAAANQAFRAALDRNARNARAWWGLGRIEQIHFRPEAARDFFAKAFGLDWRDNDIVLSYLDFVSKPADRRRLLQNVVALSRTTMPERAELAQGRLDLEDRLAGRQPAALDSDYKTYRIPLRGFRPVGSDRHGMTITARINGKRSLKLVLDTGARGILLLRHASRDLGMERLASSQLAGFGGAGAAESALSIADSVAFGELRFRDCPVEVSGVLLPEGIDGILGANLFERFRLRIDAGAQILELTPGEPESARDAKAIGLKGLLLVPGQIAEGREGWFLLDTGAAFTAIAPGLTPPAAPRSGAVSLAGVQGATAALRGSPMAFLAAGRPLSEPQPLVFDLETISQREGVKISGLLGYPTLSRWPITIDYRTGLVRIGD